MLQLKVIMLKWWIYILLSHNALVNPFMAITATLWFEVITHAVIWLTFVDKYFYMSQHSMCLFSNQHANRITVTRITGAFADYCMFAT